MRKLLFVLTLAAAACGDDDAETPATTVRSSVCSRLTNCTPPASTTTTRPSPTTTLRTSSYVPEDMNDLLCQVGSTACTTP